MPISQILDLGEDNLSNHFEMIIPPLPILGNPLLISLRVTSIEIPSNTLGTYIVVKDGQKIEMVNGVSEDPTEYTFTFRNDRFNRVYTAMVGWKEAIRKDSGLLGLNFYRRPITVIGKDSNGVLVHPGWTLTGSYPKDIAGATLDEENGEPVTYQVTMSMIRSNPNPNIDIPLIPR